MKNSNSLHTLKEAFKGGLYVEKKALRDVSFNVEKGENVGILGGNGSGKSTLLKVLAGLYPPGSGSIETKGNIAPLMDLGAGFHPELSARDNIILNATLLRQKNIDVRAIAEWANLQEQLDDPVRTFSSGMIARLAFSIATQVVPDILLVDEVLSVGDESFQIKSLSRMRKMMDSNKTIVLVTHSLGLLESQADRLIWMENGEVRDFGNPTSIIRSYLKELK